MTIAPLTTLKDKKKLDIEKFSFNVSSRQVMDATFLKFLKKRCLVLTRKAFCPSPHKMLSLIYFESDATNKILSKRSIVAKRHAVDFPSKAFFFNCSAMTYF